MKNLQIELFLGVTASLTGHEIPCRCRLRKQVCSLLPSHDEHNPLLTGNTFHLLFDERMIEAGKTALHR